MVTSRLSLQILDVAAAGKENLVNGNSLILDNAALITLANTFTLAQTFSLNDASGAAVSRPLVIRHTNSGGVGAVGIGAGLELQAETATEGTTAAAGRLDGVLTTVTAGSEVSRLDLSVLDAGAAVTPLSVATKQVTIGQTANSGANFGLLNVGGGGFAGGGTNFAGSTSGTLYAGNAAGAFAGNLLDLQLGGAGRLSVASTGTVTLADAANLVVGTTTGTRIGTSTTQKIGLYGVTPVAQQAGTTDLRTGLINLGVFNSTGAMPLNLNGGALICGSVANAGPYGGSGTAFTFKRFSLTFPSDADYVLAAGELDAVIIDVQAGVITATRNITVPGTAGGFYIVINRQAAQSVVLKTAGGTGITVPAGRARLVVAPGGTNEFALTPSQDFSV